MKKTSIFLMTLLALGMVACDDDSDLGKMQVNEQMPVMEANGIRVAYAPAIEGTDLVLEDYDGTVPVISLVETENLPEGAELSYVMYISPNEDLSGARTLDVVDGAVNVIEWNDAMRKLFDTPVNPTPQWIGFAIYADVNGQMNRMGGEDFYYLKKQITVTPKPLYMYTPGNNNGWAFGSDCWRMQSRDNNQFWGYVHLGTEFKVTDDSNWNGLILGKGATDGTLASPGDNITLPEAGFYWMLVNKADMTYSVARINSIGIIGGLTNWSSQVNLTPNAEQTVWTGEATFTDPGNLEWKFRSNDNWDINLGAPLENLSFNGSNITVPEVGTYSITLDISTIPYTAKVVKK